MACASPSRRTLAHFFRGRIQGVRIGVGSVGVDQKRFSCFRLTNVKPFRTYTSTTQHPPRLFCVVGSGPAGMYATDRLLTHYGEHTRVDILDKSPVPFGLVRFGVAPDHANTKSVTNRFDGILNDPRVSFLGNVTFGRDVTLDELTPRYHATVLAYGADGDTKLGIPNEDELNGIYSARRFVGWFNGDPNHATQLSKSIDNSLTNRCVEESKNNHSTAVIFGLGNVALDCARILLRDVDELSSTDITSQALQTLKNSNIKKVLLVGRRGVAQSAFSPKELRELLNLEGVKVTVMDDTLELEDEEDLKNSRPRRRAWEAIQKAKDIRENSESNKNKKELSVRFLRSPVEFLCDENDPGSVGSVTLEVNTLTGESGSRKAQGSGVTETIDDVTIALRSVGYKSVSLDTEKNHTGYTQSVPFDHDKGVVPNSFGRVLQKTNAAMGGQQWQVPGVYVVGWLKRGPKGIIGDNLVCAEETVGSLIFDDAKGKLRKPDYRFKDKGVGPLVVKKGIEVVDIEGWRRIDVFEKERGASVGKPREKITEVDEMLKVARG